MSTVFVKFAPKKAKKIGTDNSAPIQKMRLNIMKRKCDHA